jgi:hypothetical protein
MNRNYLFRIIKTRLTFVSLVLLFPDLVSILSVNPLKGQVSLVTTANRSFVRSGVTFGSVLESETRAIITCGRRGKFAHHLYQLVCEVRLWSWMTRGRNRGGEI